MVLIVVLCVCFLALLLWALLPLRGLGPK